MRVERSCIQAKLLTRKTAQSEREKLAGKQSKKSRAEALPFMNHTETEYNQCKKTVTLPHMCVCVSSCFLCSIQVVAEVCLSETRPLCVHSRI